MHNLLRSVALVNRSSAVLAAGGSTSSINGAGLDATPYLGVAFLVLANGFVTTGFGLKAQECSSSGFSTGSDVADLTGTLIDGTTSISDGVMGIDLLRPQKQWVRCVVVKTNTGDIIDGILSLGYLPDEAPVTQSTAKSLGFEYHVSPATGTA